MCRERYLVAVVYTRLQVSGIRLVLGVSRHAWVSEYYILRSFNLGPWLPRPKVHRLTIQGRLYGITMVGRLLAFDGVI